MFINKSNRIISLAVFAFVGLSVQVLARPNVGVNKPANKTVLLKTAAGCDPATASIDLDINNVRTKLMTGGDMWWDIGTAEARYEIPKGSKKNSLFAGSLWVGGYTPDKQLKVAAQTYRQDGNDYWPGPLEYNNGSYSIDKTVCSDWDRFWKIDMVTITKFKEIVKNGGTPSYSDFTTIFEWPAKGNGLPAVPGDPQNANGPLQKAKGTSGNTLTMDYRDYAPFVDVNGDGVYNPESGEYPDILGDQYIWWVFNDKGNTKQQSNTEAIGLEVQASAFAFATKDYLNDATFYKYTLINRSTNTLDSTFVSTWTDADLGYAFDDFIGCDTTRGLGILYNGKSVDGQGEINSYGDKIPMVGVDFFQGPKRHFLSPFTGNDTSVKLSMEAFTYYSNTSDQRLGNPTNGVQIYNYMTGSARNGQKFVNDFQGVCVQSTGVGSGTDTKYLFYGDPAKNEWSECVCCNTPNDRRFIHSSGPLTLLPNAINDIVIGVVWVANTGGCGGQSASFSKIRIADDVAQTLYDNNFQKIEGPNAPQLNYRELDRKLVFYLTNPSTSNNFLEKFGYQTDSAKYRIASLKARKFGYVDSLYKFEGYRVFQLSNSEVTPAQIFNDNGTINSSLAVEVFQCDIRNGITQMVNWTKNIDIQNCDSCYDASIKVNGKDSGIVHSFEISTDAFSTGLDKRLVNYKTYYFTAIAYAHNNFVNFAPGKNEKSQDVVYLESSSGPLGKGDPLKVVTSMPNPGYQIGTGTALGSDYGDGVIIQRIEGAGNGGNFLQLDPEAEADALLSSNNYITAQPKYLLGHGPVEVKVIDPVKVPKANWSIYIYKDTVRHPNSVYSIKPSPSAFDQFERLVDSTCGWKLVNETNGDVIYNESNLKLFNEQILSEYGLSVNISQVERPNDKPTSDGNGLISSDISYVNPALAWLAGVPDAELRSQLNWIRSGKSLDPYDATKTPPVLCNYSDGPYDSVQYYESLLANNNFTKGTWAPYSCGATEVDPACGFGVAKLGTQRPLYDLMDVDIVFTSDKSKWSKSLVVELNDEKTLTQGNTNKFYIRSHKSWTGDVDNNGNPIYATSSTDTGFSYFPGYAINQVTGERLNIIFGEDSYQSSQNGSDLIWNPTSTIIDNFGNSVFGGKHYIYISNTRYDECTQLANGISFGNNTIEMSNAYHSIKWVGLPTIANGYKLLPLKDGLIPTETRLRFRVKRPYSKFIPTPSMPLKNDGFPVYSFNTESLAPTSFNELGNTDADKYLDKILAVPNPYYAHNGYEINRLDTRVRIIGLPARATVSIYSLDGNLIRRITKDNAAVSYIDWDIRNDKSLPIASGMYLIHVQAEGIGEKIIKWFGAMRPVDITTY